MVTHRYGLLAACALIACASRAEAQLGGILYAGFGGNLSVIVPTEGLQNRWKIGFGGGVVLEPPEPGRWSATGEFGFTRLLGKTIVDPLGGESRTNDLYYWELSAGVRRKLGEGPWFVGLDGAYYVFSINGSTGLEDEAGLLPAVAFRQRSFGLTLRYKLGGDAHWAQLRFSFRGLL